MNIEELKKKAAIRAVEFIKSGMKVGLGTGSTAKYAVEEIARKLRSGELTDITGIPTSEATRALSESLGIRLSTLAENPVLDVTIDGADEVDENLNLIKGGGGALLREKIVAQATTTKIIIVDETKLSEKLGEKWALPIEVFGFALETEKIFLKALGGETVLRKNKSGDYFVTDEGNFILDTNFGVIQNTRNLADKLNERAGIAEHGLFIDLCDILIVAGSEGVEIKKGSELGTVNLKRL